MTHIECKIENNIARILLHRPEKANAYTPRMLEELMNSWQRVEKEARIALIESSGSGAFCGGADLHEMKKATAEDALELLSQRVFEQISRSTVVSIAAIQGAAVAGGFELTLACDLRVACPTAWFTLPEVSKGLIPAAGGCTRLTHLLGPSIAKGVILGGEHISAVQAHNWGLVHRLSDEPRKEALEWAHSLLTKDSLALKLAKQVLTAPSLKAERLAEAILYERKTQP